MRVETIQEANEGAPTLIQPDGNGGVTYTLITDEAITAAAQSVCDKNGWNDEEREGLYEAVIDVLDTLEEDG